MNEDLLNEYKLGIGLATLLFLMALVVIVLLVAQIERLQQRLRQIPNRPSKELLANIRTVS